MKTRNRITITQYFLILLLLLFITPFSFSETFSKNDQASFRQVILLKLDDVVADTSTDIFPVSPRWRKVVDYLEKENIKSNLGIIGYSLEENNEAYFNWIIKTHKKGLVEFWNHGYKKRNRNEKLGEFESNSVDDQSFALNRTQSLASQKLGIEFEVFGPHWSGTNSTTIRALQTLPQIKSIFYKPNDDTRFVFKRVMTLEDPVHIPNFDKFKATYKNVGADKPYLALQGHPNSWDDDRWRNFVKIIEFLKSKDVVFMTASEYIEKITQR